MKKALVIGAGSWGTTIAAMLGYQGLDVAFWGRDVDLMKRIELQRFNDEYVSHLKIPENVRPIGCFKDAGEFDFAVFVTPSKVISEMAQRLKAEVTLRGDEVFVSCSKGIEKARGLRLTQLIQEVLPTHTVAALSGPNLAEEIAAKQPTAGVVACEDDNVLAALQEAFMTPWFRCYRSHDVAGVELGGAMKNPYAIAAGIASGLKLGDNAIAALVTRALAEMVRLGVELGGQAETFYGLSGVGDLMATCYSSKSRNHQLGLALGKGESLEKLLSNTHSVVEGVPNTESLWLYAQQRGVRTPLLDAIYSILFLNKAPDEVLSQLLQRAARAEIG